MLMDFFRFGFQVEDEIFVKIGDTIDVLFHDGKHWDGILEDMRVQDQEIVVDGLVLSIGEIEQIKLLK